MARVHEFGRRDAGVVGGHPDTALRRTCFVPRLPAWVLGFVDTNWGAAPRAWSLPHCLTANDKCEAILLDLDDDRNTRC
jgi:hypothetical protein